MKMGFALACLLVLAAPAVAEEASPVGKALELLSDLQTKIIKEDEDAQKTYAEFSEWCEERSKDLSHDMKTGKAEVAELNAVIHQETATIDSLAAKIEKLAGEISVDEADLKAAAEIRGKEASVFAAQEKELIEVVDTLQRAVGILEREMKGGTSMLQLQGAQNLAQALSVLVEASMLSTSEAGRVTALVQSSAGGEDVGAPAGAVYESHSGNIVETLTNLLEEAESQLAAAREKETQDLNAFEMMEQVLEDEIKFGKKEMGEAKSASAAASEKKAAADGDLEMTSKALATDTTGLADLHHECMTKAEDFEAETKSRGEELQALAAAKEAIKENVGGADALSYGLNQVALVQIGSRITSRAGLAQFEAARLIRDLARKQQSPELAQLAVRISSAIRAGSKLGEDVFAKIKGLIVDMVEKLEKEAEEDATKKAWCDKELAESQEKKDDKTNEIEKLSTQIDKMSARSAQLQEETAALQQALSQLATSQAMMDKLRAEEKEAFAKNKADMDQGLEGIKIAVKVLSEYYAKADKAHASADGAGGGIIGLLEVVESDFTKGLAEMTATEESSLSAYDTETKENEIEKATKEQDVKYKVKQSTELDATVAETGSDRSGVQAELDAVLEYLQKIEAQCVEVAETYGERKARFEAELAGLKQALQVLEEETAFLQKGVATKMLRGVRRHD